MARIRFVAAALVLALSACSADDESTDAGTSVRPLAGPISLERVDLLLVVDDSRGMAEKQDVLADTLPDLITRLTRPFCRDAGGAVLGSADAAGRCAAGTPEVEAVRDLHAAVISSSLGGLTSPACVGEGSDDKAHLLTQGTGGVVPTYQDLGFLAWEPSGTGGADVDASVLTQKLADIALGAGAVGCGYEMPLESMLRFLADPAPYQSLERTGDGGALVRVGVDDALLAQRGAFLRDDSVVLVVMLSDENDCSVDVTSQGFRAFDAPSPRSTSECEIDPASPCCRSCALPHDGCDAGGSCAVNGGVYTAAEDHVNLRCWQQKRRYGVDFLYPVQRYVNALTLPRIDPENAAYAPADAAGGVPNPLFTPMHGGAPRSASSVFVLGIVGVPWQLIARPRSGEPDALLGPQSMAELEGALDALVGDPDRFIEPTEPFMRESIAKRTEPSALGGSPSAPNPFNGNDYDIPDADDLQYACVFDLPAAIPFPDSTECSECEAGCDKPLCDGTTQVRAKAYPSLREIAFLRGLAERASMGSVCPPQLDDASSPAYGYRGPMSRLVDSVAAAAKQTCLEESMPLDDSGQALCAIIEMTSSCDCSAPGYRAPASELAQAAAAAIPGGGCACEVVQLTANEREQCRSNPDNAATTLGDGWCVIDATLVPPLGAAELVADCPASRRRDVRFVGAPRLSQGGARWVACEGATP
jgi:hypothetical protein